MRFSLFSLLAIVTIAGVLINLGAAQSQLRKAEAEVMQLEAECENKRAEATLSQKNTEKFAPLVDQRSRMLEARESIVAQLRKLFDSQVESESHIDPVEGKISLRAIPAFDIPDCFEQGYMVHVPDGLSCSIHLKLEQDQQTFVGIESDDTTFALATGLNKLFLRYRESAEDPIVFELELNGEIVATADAEGTGSRSSGSSRPNYDSQRDFTEDLRPRRLCELSPTLTYGEREHAVEIELTLVPGESND